MTARRTFRRDVVCSTTHAVPLDGACPPAITIAREELDAVTTRYRIDGTAAAAERVDDLDTALPPGTHAIELGGTHTVTVRAERGANAIVRVER